MLKFSLINYENIFLLNYLNLNLYCNLEWKSILWHFISTFYINFMTNTHDHTHIVGNNQMKKYLQW